MQELKLQYFGSDTWRNTKVIAFDEGERILILPWAQAGCQINLRDFRPGDRLAASTSCATVSDMVTKLYTSYIEFSFFQHVELRTTDNQISQPIAIAPSLSIVVYANP